MSEESAHQNAVTGKSGGLFCNLRGDLSGGLSAAVIALPVAISCGVVAFAPMGPDFAAYGALAGLNTAIFVTLVAGLLGGSPLQITGPKSSLAVILGAVMAGLMADPLMPTEEGARAGLAIVLTFICVIMAGVFQVIFGLLRFGNLIKFIPYPVTAGFMNGLAIIIVISQLPVFVNARAVNLDTFLYEQLALRPKAVLVCLLTIAAMWLARLWLRRGGDALLALVIGTAVYYGLERMYGAKEMGGVIGPVVRNAPYPKQLFNIGEVLADPNADLLLLGLVGPALVIALLGSIESLLSATAMDAHRHVRHDSNRELIGQGVANAVGGAFSGLAGGGSPTRSVANFDAGGRTRLSSVVQALFFLMVITVMGPLVAKIPLAATAGILIVYAFRMVDGWTRQLIVKMGRIKGLRERRDVAVNLLVVGLVTLLTVTMDLVTAIGAGFAVASFLFIVRAGQSPIYRHYTGAQVQSKNARPLSQMEILRAQGAAVAVVEARGAVFFGSAERLAERLETLAETADTVILDLRRVTEIDATGAHIFRRFDRYLTRQDKVFLLSHLREGDPLWGFLKDMEVIGPENQDQVFADSDAALTWAEDRLLAAARETRGFSDEMALADMEVLAGLDAEQVEVLRTAMSRETFAAGERIFEEGGEGDSMYFLAAGSVDVQGRLTNSGREVRFAGIGPGVVFGEMAILGDMARSASIDARESVVCYKLSKSSFERLVAERPDLVIRLLLNLGRQSAHRLDMTSAVVRALAE